MLDPTQLPTFQVLVRFPPSLVYGNAPALYIPSLRMGLERMNVVFGDMRGIVDFGNFNLTSNKGGVQVQYLAGKNISITAGYNDIKGTWNVSNSLNINGTQ
jgi:hypothetical protein